MSDWFSNFTQPSVRVTYGSKPKPISRAFSHAPNEVLQEESSPQTNTSLPPKRVLNRAMRIFSSGEKKRKDRDGTVVEDMKFTKVKMDMKDIIRDGYLDDLNYLYQQLEKYEQVPSGERGFGGLVVDIPTHWEPSDCRRLEDWLQAIGMKVSEFSHKVSYTCSTNKVRIQFN